METCLLHEVTASSLNELSEISMEQSQEQMMTLEDSHFLDT